MNFKHCFYQDSSADLHCFYQDSTAESADDNGDDPNLDLTADASSDDDSVPIQKKTRKVSELTARQIATTNSPEIRNADAS